MSDEMRRISVLIRQDQYERLSELGLNVSGLIRDLIDDRLSGSTVTLAVGSETQHLYERIVANTGATDAAIEPYLLAGLKELLAREIENLQQLQRSLESS